MLFLFKKPVDWDDEKAKLQGLLDESVKELSWAKGGTKAGFAQLHAFLFKRLGGYATGRNDPTKDVLSNLSPWFHFGEFCIFLTRQYACNAAFQFSLDHYLFLLQRFQGHKCTNLVCGHVREVSYLSACAAVDTLALRPQRIPELPHGLLACLCSYYS